MEFEAREALISKIGVQHFHVTVGPEMVNLYETPGFTYAGPFYDITAEGPEEAGVLWVRIVNTVLNGYFNEEDAEWAVEDIIDHADESEFIVSFTIHEAGYTFALDECWGCIPRHNN